MPIPQIVTHEINEDGSLGTPNIKKSKEGVIRQVDHGIIMNLDTAKKINLWLNNHIIALEKLINQGDFSDSDE